MENVSNEGLERRFNSPQEEISFLREKILEKEREVEKQDVTADREKIIHEEVSNYKKLSPEIVLHPDYKISPQEKEGVVLDLSKETHDGQMEELLGTLEQKGILNTLSIIEKMMSSHIEDDFHRLLVQYLKAHLPIQGLKEDSPIFRGLNMTLFEIALASSNKKGEQSKPLKEMISAMEQFYAGMLSVEPNLRHPNNYFTVEISNSILSGEFMIYVAVPDTKKDLFEKQIISIFPDAKISERKDDYNIFNPEGVSSGSYAEVFKNPIFPIKTYEHFDYDPLNIVLNTFSKIARNTEGAAIQLVFHPTDDYYPKRYKDALKQIQGGVPVKTAVDVPDSFMGDLWKAVKTTIKEEIKEESESKKQKEKEKTIDQVAVEQIEEKIKSPIVLVNLRILSSAPTKDRSDSILSDLESAFNQFENTQGSSLRFKRAEKHDLTELIRYFSFRLYSDHHSNPLNIHEITTIMHFPTGELTGNAPQLHIAKAGTAPAPVDLQREGILLGVNRHRNVETPIYMSRQDRLRHFYTIGQTGTGKTTLLKNMIIQDIKNGDGVCMIDPHGADIQDVLSLIPPERYEDVIYFDPGYTDRPMALNMLEYDVRFPEQKTFVVNELFSIFQKLYGAVPESMGPIFEQYFRNAAMLVIEDPETGSTLLDISRVLVDKEYRSLKLSHCKNPVIVQFWREQAEKAGGEASLANMVPYITSKFDVFLANEIMRPIIAQEKSSFNFREIMDNKKILLVNLSKGRLGDINSSLIGLIIVGKILMAALSRIDSFGQEMPDFYLYIDEFQNVTTPSISTILSEARKYKLSLNIAHQFIAQLDEKIRDSVFGNVGTMAVFRVGADDAEYLEKQFEPVFSQNDMINLDNRIAYLKLLSNGRPARPFSLETIAPLRGDSKIIDNLKELSYLKYGKDRTEVESEISKRYQKPTLDPLSGIV
ncbi:MAG: TraM recognition domain-containing protein [Candidatus Paceibacterota bacterium]